MTLEVHHGWCLSLKLQTWRYLHIRERLTLPQKCIRSKQYTLFKKLYEF